MQTGLFEKCDFISAARYDQLEMFGHIFHYNFISVCCCSVRVKSLKVVMLMYNFNTRGLFMTKSPLVNV